MHLIEAYVTEFLGKVNRGEVKIPPHLLEKFGTETVEALQKQFEKGNDRKFSLRMSNVGKPLCQLQMEKKYGSTYLEPIRGLLGDLVEDVVLLMLHLIPEIKVVAELEPVEVAIGGITLKGTLDVILNVNGINEVYDIKSASDFAFRKYSNASFEDFYGNDAFGYVEQLFAYAYAANTKPGGWIFINKSSGEVKVISVPSNYPTIMQESLKNIEYRIKSIDTPFSRCFPDLQEKFRKKFTGNKILGTTCSFCTHKFQCWPTLTPLPQIDSTSQNPTLKYYTFIKNKSAEIPQEYLEANKNYHSKGAMESDDVRTESINSGFRQMSQMQGME